MDRNSDLERLSFDALRSALPLKRFLIRDSRSEDYGVDAVIELRESGFATNLFTQVQLKAVDHPALKADGTVSLKVDTKNLNYLTSGPCATCGLYVLYVDSTKELRFAWAAEERSRIEASIPHWQEQDTVTLRFGSSSLRDDASLNEIYTRIALHGGTKIVEEPIGAGLTSEGVRRHAWAYEEENHESEIGDNPERLVDTRGRIRQIRDDLGLNLSRFAKLLACDERALGRIETGKDQTPIRLVQRVTEISGVRFGWLELGEPPSISEGSGRRYGVRYIPLHCAPDYLPVILSLKPKHLYFCLEPWSKEVVVVAQLTDYNWRVYSLERMNLWEWQGSRFHIPKVRDFLKNAIDPQKSPIIYSSCYLSAIVMRRILAGDIHPMMPIKAATRRAIRHERGHGKYWTEDLVDIYGEREGIRDTEEDYAREYGGWFVKARQMMRDWDGAIHPFELASRSRAAHEKGNEVEAEGCTTDGPCVSNPASEVVASFPSTFCAFSSSAYGNPINLLPQGSRKHQWWRCLHSLIK